jgi:hypothetical protein
MFITDYVCWDSQHGPTVMGDRASTYDILIAHSVLEELKYYCDLNEWPRYFRQVLFCLNHNEYKNRLKLACFWTLNKYSYKLLEDCLLVLSPWPLTNRNLMKLRGLEKYLSSDHCQNRYSSYYVRSKIVLYLGGRIRFNTGHAQNEYSDSAHCQKHLDKYGLSKIIDI